MNDSTIASVSVRAWLAMGTVFSGLAFLYATALIALQGDVTSQIGLTIVVAVISFVNLALGYYLGQKSQGPTEVETVNNISDSTVRLPPPPPSDAG